MNSTIRDNGFAINIQQEQLKTFTNHEELTDSSGFVKLDKCPTSEFVIGLDKFGDTLSGETNEPRSLTLASYEYNNHGTPRPIDSKDENFQNISSRTSDDTDEAVIGTFCSHASVSSFMKMDPLIWIPPEPANIEDDMDSIANNDEDDDDDYNDGTKWGHSTSLNGFDKQNGNSHKEARQKAMVAAMNGQFKILVNRFLASEGLNSGDEGNDVGWLDIVTFLSWESALFIKPDAKEGRAMDPGSYVKVKCVATGARSQSKVIKGLVFKKNAAHKHMPTKFKNPRLLLVKGNLGPHEVGLSSFNSMDQEKDCLKSINEMIECCHPNLVLVEKSVSRDIQEFLLAKGMTLAFDMKLTRLERIARCSGSQIVSSIDFVTDRYVKQCDTFHIEKFLEDHNNSSEFGRRSSKTLMFLEGFAKPLGCTILLKGAHTDELKRVKRVLQYTIFAAYHLILETSFFADQRALFSKIHSSSEIDRALTDKALPAIASVAAPVLNSSCHVSSSNGSLENPAYKVLYAARSDVCSFSDDMRFPNIEGFEDNFTQGGLHSDLLNQNVVIQTSSVTTSDLSRHLMSSFSASLKKLLLENMRTPYTSESFSSFFGFKDDEYEYRSLNDLPISPSAWITDNGKEKNDKILEGNESTQSMTAIKTSKIESDGNDDNDNILSPESILVLLSSQCIEKGLVCEQNHLSRIKYYGNFDISLGRYLQDVLLNQKHSCSSCGEPPEAHIYCYTHQNGNLTVLVRQLPSSSSLSGETEGKIWMWSRCLKCEHESGVPRSTTRVVMSSAARSLSFGKFLELSFTSHSAASRLCSECGHSLHRDCLRFFGLGSKVAMFRYSPVEIYAACKPLPMLEFANPSGQEWVVQEAKSVIQKVDNFFSEVASFLHNMKLSCPGLLYKQSSNFPGIVKSICDAEEMLSQEKLEFEASLHKVYNFAGELEKPVNELPNFSWLHLELIFWLYIWDCRLHQLLQCSKDLDRSLDENGRYIDRANIKNCQIASAEETHIPISNCDYYDQTDFKSERVSLCNSIDISQNSEILEMKFSTEEADFDQSAAEDAATTVKQDDASSTCVLSTKENEDCGTCEHMHEDNTMESSELFHKVASSDMLSVSRISENVFPSLSLLKEQHSRTRILDDSSTPVFGDPKSSIWVPFPELRKACKMDLHGGYLQKFEFTRTYTPKYLSPMHQLFPQERGLLHYHFVANGSVMCVYEDEISSIIACALALSEDHHCLLDNIVEKDVIVDKLEGDRENDIPSSLQSESLASSYSSSNGSLDSVGGIHHSWSFSSISLDELSTSTSESVVSVDRLLVSENLHPEIPLGTGKYGSKKYSVVCIHAKEFYALRRMCCPSEQAYISSLSRCRKWDAQGGKSKAFFAKSMDDRFIIKQIKKAELDSFLKFSGDYFKHITHSLSSGSQTCLAKILGIYQVRQNRNGKEVKIDLMVMENLLFGHNVMRTYDLKGAVFSRYIADSNAPETVLLDQNFVEDMRLSPIYVGGRTKQLLQRAIWNDTSFLNAINVMDYSLLVGVDKRQRQLVFGIIDYLRQYTWDKQLETWVKASLVVPKNSLPTIISPKEYKKRFRKFMSRYFLTVPDSWCSTQYSEACKTHGTEPQQCDV